MRLENWGMRSAHSARYIDRETQEQTSILLTPLLGQWAIIFCARNQPPVIVHLCARLGEAKTEGFYRAAVASHGPLTSRSQIWCELQRQEIPGMQSVWTEVALPPDVELFLRRFSN